MPELEQPKFPTTEKPHLSPNPHDLKTEYEDAGRGTPVIENTQPKAQPDAQQAVEIALKKVYEAIDEVYELIGEATEIVTIESTGVQSDAMAAKVEAAKAVYYDNRLYSIMSNDGTTIYFRAQTQTNNLDTNYFVEYTIATKYVTVSLTEHRRVREINGKYGAVSIDDSLQTTGVSLANATLGLTGKLPYLTTAPSADNTSGFLTIVVLDAEPATKYDGYLYLISGSVA